MATKVLTRGVLVHTTLVRLEIPIHCKGHVQWPMLLKLSLDARHTRHTVSIGCFQPVRLLCFTISRVTARSSASWRWILTRNACCILGGGRHMMGTRNQTVWKASLTTPRLRIVTSSGNTSVCEPVPRSISRQLLLFACSFLLPWFVLCAWQQLSWVARQQVWLILPMR